MFSQNNNRENQNYNRTCNLVELEGQAMFKTQNNSHSYGKRINERKVRFRPLKYVLLLKQYNKIYASRKIM